MLQAPVNVAVQVVDSGGFVVTKGAAFGTVQSLSFCALPYAGGRLRAQAAAGQGEAATTFGSAADDTLYYLEIVPAADVDLSQSYELQIETEAVIREPVRQQTYVPLVERQGETAAGHG